jgi:histidinol-phosphate aminotransferase
MWVNELIDERARLAKRLEVMPFVEKVYPSDANFLLVKVDDANAKYNNLMSRGVIVRNRHSVALCLNCLRITVGTPQENDILIDELGKM